MPFLGAGAFRANQSLISMSYPPRMIPRLLGLSLFGALFAFSGCKTDSPETNASLMGGSTSYAWQGFPKSAASPSAAQILIEKETPTEINPGAEYTYRLTISNRATYAVDELTLTETLPNGFELARTVPTARRDGENLVWTLGRLAPGQNRVLSVTGRSKIAGTVRHSGTARIDFALTPARTEVAVIEPSLELLAQSPGSVLITDPIPVSVTFRNAGTAPLKNARLINTLPKGLLTSEGRSKLELYAGDLEAGQAKTFDFHLRAEDLGLYETTFTAVARDGYEASVDFRTAVQKPQLQLTAQAPERRFVGDIIPYTLTVENVGDGIARGAQVRQSLPEGTALASASESGTAEENSVLWNLGDLRPGEKRTVTARLVAKNIMTARATAEATASAADPVYSSLVTDVAGIAAILLRVGDLNDPVPVGETEVYEITATNQGSLAATRLVVKCILEDGMEFVSSSGATKARPQGNLVVFDALPALDPQAEANWRIEVRAAKEGDVRFTASIESEQLSRPVVENEATHFYR